MRLPPDKLAQITGLSLPSAQARWFSRHFGVSLPADRDGPIITPQAFEALVARRCGLSDQAVAARPQVRLTRKA